METQGNLFLLHLVDGSEIIASIQGRLDGQVQLIDPRAVVIAHGKNENDQEVITWQIGYVHVVQRLNPGVQAIPPIQSNQILYAFSADLLPQGLIDNYYSIVQEHYAQIEAALAANQQVAAVSPEAAPQEAEAAQELPAIDASATVAQAEDATNDTQA